MENTQNGEIKICLNMIVKNESRIIKRCLDSLSSIIDYVVITDTGSTDNTKELIEEYLEQNNKKGKVYFEPWQNFGYNRTNSIYNARTYLKEIDEDLTKIYLLFVDADMKIVIKPEFNKNSLRDVHVGQLIQKNPGMEYYNTRICRSDIDITCAGVTHEYYNVPGNFENKKITSIYIDDIGDGGSKNDKFERDIKLLEQGLIDEPNNERYLFYLAQSYNCVGKVDQSIEYYKKRIDVGGWREEIFYSNLMIGNMYKDVKNDWPLALHYYLKSFQASGGVRSEGVLKIVEHYKNTREYHLALLFIEKLLKVKYPVDDVLFIDYSAYTYKPYNELAIIAYYLNMKHEGLLASQYLLMDRRVETPGHVRSNLYYNMVFYLKQFEFEKMERLEDVMVFQYYKPSSSSFRYSIENSPNDDLNIYEGVLRTVNYSINDNGNYLYPPHMDYIHTENYWTVLNDNKIVEQYRIKLSPTMQTEYKRQYYGIQGLEDGRHIKYNGKTYISFTSFEYGKEAKASMVLTRLNDKYQIDKIVSLKYHEDRIQKNWVPFEYEGKLCFVYSYQPFVILSVDPETGNCEEIVNKQYQYHLGDLRGSAPPIWIEKHQCYLIMTHEVIMHGTRKYIHRFLMFDRDWNLLKIGEPFYFKNLFIEFSLSIIYNPKTDKLIIPFSVRDGESFIGTSTFEKIRWLPDSIPKYFENFTY